MSDIEITPLEVYAMVIARDALLEQILTMIGAPELATLWRHATDEYDHQIRNGLMDQIIEEL